MNPRVIIGLIIVIAACGAGERQSFRAAVGVLCASDEEAGVANVHPAERQAAKARWIDARLKNREVRDVFVRMPDMAPKERAVALFDLAARAGIASCKTGEPAVFASVDLADVTGAGAEPIGDEAGITVVVNQGDLSVEGTAVVPLIDGAVDASERESGDNPHLPRLRKHLATHLELALAHARRDGRPPTPPRVLVVMPRGATFTLLIDIMQSAKRAGFTRFGLVGRRDGNLVAVPITLRTADDALPPETSPQLVVAVPPDGMVLFSISGREGTIQAPALRTTGTTPDDLVRLQQALVEIASRHTDERQLIAMFDASTPMQSILAVLATIRARPDGRPLLPDVTLAAGFH